MWYTSVFFLFVSISSIYESWTKSRAPDRATSPAKPRAVRSDEQTICTVRLRSWRVSCPLCCETVPSRVPHEPNNRQLLRLPRSHGTGGATSPSAGTTHPSRLSLAVPAAIAWPSRTCCSSRANVRGLWLADHASPPVEPRAAMGRQRRSSAARRPASRRRRGLSQPDRHHGSLLTPEQHSSSTPLLVATGLQAASALDSSVHGSALSQPSADSRRRRGCQLGGIGFAEPILLLCSWGRREGRRKIYLESFPGFPVQRPTLKWITLHSSHVLRVHFVKVQGQSCKVPVFIDFLFLNSLLKRLK